MPVPATRPRAPGRTLRQVGFRGVSGLEYEGAKEETLAGLAETVGYLRGVLRST